MTEIKKTARKGSMLQPSRTLQSMVDDLIPYLKSIVIDEQNEYVPMMYILGYKHWEIPDSEQFVINMIGFNDQLDEIEISIVDTSTTNLDNLVEFVYKNIIQYNEILEQKQAEINENIKRIELEKQKEIEEMKRNLLNINNIPPKQPFKRNEQQQVSPPVVLEQQTPYYHHPVTYPNHEQEPTKGNTMKISLKDLRAGNIGDFNLNTPEEIIVKERIMNENAELFQRDTEDE